MFSIFYFVFAPCLALRFFTCRSPCSTVGYSSCCYWWLLALCCCSFLFCLIVIHPHLTLLLLTFDCCYLFNVVIAHLGLGCCYSPCVVIARLGLLLFTLCCYYSFRYSIHPPLCCCCLILTLCCCCHSSDIRSIRFKHTRIIRFFGLF